ADPWLVIGQACEKVAATVELATGRACLGANDFADPPARQVDNSGLCRRRSSADTFGHDRSTDGRPSANRMGRALSYRTRLGESNQPAISRLAPVWRDVVPHQRSKLANLPLQAIGSRAVGS